jgi:hypothetical protein
MRAVFTFTPAESKRLIGRAVAQSEPVIEALERAYVVVAGGTTNAYVAQELTGLQIAPERFTAGTSAQRVLCVTPLEQRDDRIPIVLYKGERVERTVSEVFEDSTRRRSSSRVPTPSTPRATSASSPPASTVARWQPRSAP